MKLTPRKIVGVSLVTLLALEPLAQSIAAGAQMRPAPSPSFLALRLSLHKISRDLLPPAVETQPIRFNDPAPFAELAGVFESSIRSRLQSLVADRLIQSQEAVELEGSISQLLSQIPKEQHARARALILQPLESRAFSQGLTGQIADAFQNPTLHRLKLPFPIQEDPEPVTGKGPPSPQVQRERPPAPSAELVTPHWGSLRPRPPAGGRAPAKESRKALRNTILATTVSMGSLAFSYWMDSLAEPIYGEGYAIAYEAASLWMLSIFFPAMVYWGFKHWQTKDKENLRRFLRSPPWVKKLLQTTLQISRPVHLGIALAALGLVATNLAVEILIQDLSAPTVGAALIAPGLFGESLHYNYRKLIGTGGALPAHRSLWKALFGRASPQARGGIYGQEIKRLGKRPQPP
ncbi:MAG: hypothetical protein HY402_03430 [Elusimicrobia bacterium]|nr:hypothetical protein [Elusimicrobiota bacterium]